MLADEDVQAVLRPMIVRRIAETAMGPRSAGAGHAAPKPSGGAAAAARRPGFQWSLNGGPIIERVVERDSATWSRAGWTTWSATYPPDCGLHDKVRRNPDHELRRSAPLPVRVRRHLQPRPGRSAGRERQKQIMARDEIARPPRRHGHLKRIFLESSMIRHRPLRTASQLGDAHRRVTA